MEKAHSSWRSVLTPTQRWSRSLISGRVNQRCLSAATRAAIDLSMAWVVSLVARRDRSAVLRSSLMSYPLTPSPSSSSLSRSAWYACRTAMVCRHEPAWPATTYILPTSAEDVRSGLEGKVGASQTTQHQGTDSSRASVPPAASLCNRTLSSLPHYHRNLRKGWRGGPRKVFPTTSTPQCEGRKKRQAPMWRWHFKLQKAFISFASLWFD